MYTDFRLIRLSPSRGKGGGIVGRHPGRSGLLQLLSLILQDSGSDPGGGLTEGLPKSRRGGCSPLYLAGGSAEETGHLCTPIDAIM